MRQRQEERGTFGWETFTDCSFPPLIWHLATNWLWRNEEKIQVGEMDSVRAKGYYEPSCYHNDEIAISVDLGDVTSVSQQRRGDYLLELK